MPIVYVHGVANRVEREDYWNGWEALQRYLERYLSPVISLSRERPAKAWHAYWGDLGANFAFDGRSRPLSPLLRQGSGAAATASERAIALAGGEQAFRDSPFLPEPQPEPPGPLISGGSRGRGDAAASSSLRLRNLSPDDLSDLLAAELQRSPADPVERAQATILADEIAHDPGTWEFLAKCPSLAAESEVLQQLLAERVSKEDRERGALLAQGPIGRFFSGMADRLQEIGKRVDHAPGFLASRLAVEARRPLNDLATLFLGDVFAYLTNRDLDFGDPTKNIPTRVLEVLSKARKEAPEGEPLVILTHSMGGQIIYDLVTHYIPELPEYRDLRIDFWCATASQVALFAELDLFRRRQIDPLLAPGATHPKLPLPDRRFLGGWWNVWDHNDIISYTAGEIFADIDDEPYNSGESIVTAHGGYLRRPSFFRRFAERVRRVKEINWNRDDAAA